MYYLNENTNLGFRVHGFNYWCANKAFLVRPSGEANGGHNKYPELTPLNKINK